MATLSTNSDSDANALFRKFSYSVEARMPPNTTSEEPIDDDLAIAVVERRKTEDLEELERAEWRKYFDPWEASDDPEIEVLDIQGNALSEAWAQFRAQLPPDEQIEFAKRAQNFEDVINVVNRVEKKWQQKKKKGVFGHTKHYYRRVCAMLDSHSTLLEVLPSGSQYASVFCGTLQTLIQASANYDKIAAGLSRSLLEITEAAESCVKECSLYPTKTMQHSVADLYSHIFLFLRDVLSWYTKKSITRMLASFKEDFYEQFEEQVTNIKQISQSIERKASHAANSELRYTRLLVEDVRKNQRLALKKEEREAAERRHQERRAIEEKERESKKRELLEQEQSHRVADLLQIMGTSFKSICVEEVHKILAVQNFGTPGGLARKATRPRQLPSTLSTSRGLEPLTAVQRREDIQVYSSGLEDYYDSDAIMVEHDQAVDYFVDWPVVAALQEWTVATEARFLCIVGPYQTTGERSMTSLIAAKYAASTSEAKLPVISFFVGLPRKAVASDHSPEEEAPVSLAYALIRQLIELLPSEFESEKQFQSTRFEAFDGTLDSWPDVLAVLKDLLDLAPLVLFCVIDGFELLEDRETQQSLDDFIGVLEGHSSRNAENAKRTFKVLFTTAGKSKSLLEHLTNDELVFAERPSSGRKPGKQSSGRRPLSPDDYLRELETLERDEE